MAELKIERLGGLGGFGLPGSRLRSEGRIDSDALDEADRRRLEDLFASGSKSPPVPDGFRYRIVWTDKDGERVVELSESEVPAALVRAVRDEIR